MFIYPLYYHNWRNINTIYIYNKTSIKRNILTIKKMHREVGRAKDLSEPRVYRFGIKSNDVLSIITNFLNHSYLFSEDA